jgi:hypothetical protein
VIVPVDVVTVNPLIEPENVPVVVPGRVTPPAGKLSVKLPVEVIGEVPVTVIWFAVPTSPTLVTPPPPPDTVAQDAVVPLVVRNLPELPVCVGSERPVDTMTTAVFGPLTVMPATVGPVTVILAVLIMQSPFPP